MRVTGVQPRISRTARMSMPYSSWARLTVRYCDWSASLRVLSDMFASWTGPHARPPIGFWIGGTGGNLSGMRVFGRNGALLWERTLCATAWLPRVARDVAVAHRVRSHSGAERVRTHSTHS